MRNGHVQDFRQKIIGGYVLIEKKVSTSPAIGADRKRSARELALRIISAAKEKKAGKAVLLDMRETTCFCDYFAILSGNSLRQVNAIAEAIQEDLNKEKIKPLSKVPSGDESGWMVLDYMSVVAHIFYKPMREFYSLERLWSEAKRVRIPREKKSHSRLNGNNPVHVKGA